MRTGLVIVAAIALRWGLGCRAASAQPDGPAPPPLLGRYHFVGIGRLAGKTNAAKLQTIWRLPATRQLRDQLLPQIARLPARWWAPGTPTSRDAAGALARPLLDDLLHAESYGQWWGHTNQLLEWTLAIRLDHARARLWQTNTAQLAVDFGFKRPGAPHFAGAAGWETQDQRTRLRLRFLRAGPWTVLAGGMDGLIAQAGLVRRLERHQLPWTDSNDAWLTARADLARLQGWLQCPLLHPWPQARLTLTGEAGSLRTVLALAYPHTMNWREAPWRVPTHVIRGPIVSFTAARGVASWLAECPQLKQAGLDPLPNQLFLWAQDSRIPVQTFAAAPVPHVDEALRRITDRLPALLGPSLQTHHLGHFVWLTNRAQLVWIGLPFIYPGLSATNEPAGQFLVAQLFPPLPSTNPPPAAMLAQVTSHPNLLYYDWEITQDRLRQWRTMTQLYSIIASFWRSTKPGPAHLAATTPPPGPLSDIHAPTQQWLLAIAPLLGNTVTGLLAVSPHELLLRRKSPIGLTGLELVLLARWLENHFAFQPVQTPPPTVRPTPGRRRAPRPRFQRPTPDAQTRRQY